MDDDDDYFTPSACSSRRLAMLFSPEEVARSSSNSSSTGVYNDPSTQFRYVAPKQPRPNAQQQPRNNTSSSTLSGSGQASLENRQEVYLEVPLSMLPQGAERNGMPRTPVSCQVVGSMAKRCFSLVVVAVAVKVEEEQWRAAVDSHLVLEVVERSVLKVTGQSGNTLMLLGEPQQIKALVIQLAICRGVASDRVTQQDLCVGKGHILAEGDVAKVSCTTYTITSAACTGEKVEDVRGVRVTVSSPATGSWESCLAGASVNTHRLIFIPKHKEGRWLPPSAYHDVTVAKVKSRGGAKEKAAAAETDTVIGNQQQRWQQQQQQQQQSQLPTSNHPPDASNPLSCIGQNGERSKFQGFDTPEEEEEDDGGASKKAALISRMAQVGTPLFPLVHSVRPVPCSQPSQVTSQAAEESRGPLAKGVLVPPSTTAPVLCSHTHALSPVSTHALNSTSTPVYVTATATTSDLASAPVSVLTSVTTNTTTTPTPGPVLGPASSAGLSFLTPQPQALDTTLALSICQLGTTVTKISERVDCLLAKVERVEGRYGVEAGGGSCPASFPTSDPEALMALASGLVAHNERLRAQLDVAERRLADNQAALASLITVNTQLLDEKREMLRMEDEDKKEKLRKEIKHNEKQEDQRKTEASQQRETEASQQRETDANQQRETEANQQRETEASQQRDLDAGQQRDLEANQQRETEANQQRETQHGSVEQHGLTPEKVRSLFKGTLSGLFRHLTSDLSEEETHFTRLQVLHTLRSGLEMAYSSLVRSLEEMAGEDEEVVVGGRGKRRQQNEDEEENNNGGLSAPSCGCSHSYS